MKTFLSFCAMGLASGLSLAGFNARADLEVSASVSIHARADFYEPLTTYGAWVDVGSYGRCWRPARVAVEWRPYCFGHWVWTDCGWYWDSDEPWGWACYHYGRWIFDPAYGWVWVPDIEWGPAWVSWREGGGYIGWAPLPPRGLFFARVAAPSLFVFVEANHFFEPHRPSTVIVNRTTIINQTTTINNIRRETRDFEGIGRRKVVINDGPGLAAVQKATGKTVKAVPIRDAARQTSVPPGLLRKSMEAPGKEKAFDVRDQSRPPRQRKGSPEERPQPPSQRATPDRGTPPARDEMAPHPGQRPAVPGAPPSAPPGIQGEKNRGPEGEKGKGHEKDNGRGHEKGGEGP